MHCLHTYVSFQAQVQLLAHFAMLVTKCGRGVGLTQFLAYILLATPKVNNADVLSQDLNKDPEILKDFLRYSSLRKQADMVSIIPTYESLQALLQATSLQKASSRLS